MGELRQLLMPKIGLTMTEGTVSEWPVAEGQSFAAGEIYVIVETDKVANELEAPEAGTLRRILVQAGETVPVGAVLAEWEPGAAVQAVPPAASPAPVVAAPASAEEVRKASATELTIARRLSEAKQGIPHFYLQTEFRVNRLQAQRKAWNGRSGQPRATLTHLFVAAFARALATHRDLNRVWTGEGFRMLQSIDIGIAVDVPQGLVVPVLRAADRLGLAELCRAVDTLVERARQGTLTTEDVGGGLMTISNAGMYDVTWMSSIINPGQSAILGVGSERAVFRPDDSGAPALVHEIGVVLSCDHRAFGGVQALRLLNAAKAAMEQPDALFA